MVLPLSCCDWREEEGEMPHSFPHALGGRGAEQDRLLPGVGPQYSDFLPDPDPAVEPPCSGRDGGDRGDEDEGGCCGVVATATARQ